MTFEALREFISVRMRMSHVYQPVMLRALFCRQGRASVRDVAREILANDESQIEYYENITRNMVGRVLRNHGIVDKVGTDYVLRGFDLLSSAQVEELLALCEAKLQAYLERRGERMWQHRKLAAGYISGTLRFDVLKRAAFRCELCGVSADVKALEVDHILPRNQGGSDDPDNLQALCYSCNAMKRDRDSTDFRAVRASYEHREPKCLFCNGSTNGIIAENTLAFAIEDRFPVTALHTLIAPKRHVPDYFELSRPELNACDSLIRQMRIRILGRDSEVCGFNIGANAGAAAGQTIFHCHIHVIPRRVGDVADPRGGVRHTIPEKGFYG